MDWNGLDIVEQIPGKVSGAPILVGTRIPASAIVENYEGFIDDGIGSEAAIRETLDCYPAAGEQRIRALLAYHYAHQAQPQP